MPSNLEIAAVLLAFFAVILQWREHQSTWYLVLLSSLLYIKIFYDVGLIWDATLQLFFIALAVRGIFSWRKELALTTPRSRSVQFHGSILLLAALPTVCLALFSIYFRHMPSITATADSAIFVGSLLAVWLTERKIIECWWYWIVIDCTAAALYLSRDLLLTSILYAVYVPLAFFGLQAWRTRAKSVAFE